MPSPVDRRYAESPTAGPFRALKAMVMVMREERYACGCQACVGQISDGRLLVSADVEPCDGAIERAARRLAAKGML